MNRYIKSQITTMISSLNLFVKSLEISALQDDGIISKEEDKIIRKLKKVTEKYKEELEKIEGD